MANTMNVRRVITPMLTRLRATLGLVMIVTPRLVLRDWKPEDREPFAGLNADPEVMRYFASALAREQSDAFADRIEAHGRQHGFTFWAAELKETGEFAGMIGMAHVPFDAFFTPAVEIGWRLSRKFWNRGLATEGARAALAFGFGRLGLDRIVAFTSEHNRASERVMEKAGMWRLGDFAHPRLSADHPLSRHIVYEAKASTWLRAES